MSNIPTAENGTDGDWFFHKHENGKLFILPLKDLIQTSDTYNKRVDATNVKNIVGRGVPRMRDFPVPSCNGLILLSSTNNELVWRIWNPFTAESVVVKQYREFENVKHIEGDHPVCGVGYDEANDDYKVVRIVGPRAFVYSVNLDEWRRIEDFPKYGISRWYGVFAYGALHWVVNSSRLVVALDLSTEKYREIPLPSEINEHEKCGKLHALSGCLFVGCFNLEGHFCAWIIQDYGCGNKWTKIILVEDHMFMLTMPLAYLKSKRQVLIHQKQYLPYKQDEYLWYDLRTKCTEKVRIEIPDDWPAGSAYIGGWFTSQVFPANLIRIKGSDCSDEDSPSQGTSKRKRQRAMAKDRLPLEITFTEPEDWTSDDEPVFSETSDDEPVFSGSSDDEPVFSN